LFRQSFGSKGPSISLTVSPLPRAKFVFCLLAQFLNEEQ
jgi:hypothetical protein